ncbi:hypothetical protein AB685_10560 [Bacillus sp. LL01]|uniref:hypothetical protein n=1 Tax=Bacillus sp. LL01 TaxID=1665556 RepID=UPI00064D03CB|nr:hypothetical protein [Bacillus sp. LL01]KMJ58336.1 hypothetical protein AB685_10560 [Bacillus sp. LL01]
MLKKFLPVLFLIVAIVGCGNQNEIENTKGPSIMEARKEPGRLSSEELLRDARNEAMIQVENPPTEAISSKEQAKSKVMDHLDLTEHDSTSVSFEGMQGKYYVFHVSNLVHFNNQPEKLSRGWYRVNRNTGEVSPWEED